MDARQHRSGLWRDIAVFVSLSSADEFSCKVVLRLVVLAAGCLGRARSSGG